MEDHISPVTEPKVTPPAKKMAYPTPEKPKPSGRRGWVWLLLLLLAGTGAWYLWSKRGAMTPSAGGTADAKAGKKGGGAVPVVAVKAHKGTIHVFINGLGAVTPINTVTVRSRVDGQLMSVHFKEGDIVHKGDLLVEIDPRPFNVALEQAEAQKAKDEANLKNARVDLTRYTDLLKTNAVPEQQVATQQATVDQDVAVVKTDDAQIDSAKLNLVYCNITAEVTGRVGLRLVDPGNIVHATDTNGMLVITQIQPISTIFTVAEDDLQVVLQKLAAGQHLPAEAWDRNNNARIGTGTLSTVDNQIDPTTGSLRLRAIFDNGDNKLFPNQFVNVRLLVQQKDGVTVVNQAAIQRSTSSTYVFVVQPNKTVTVRQIVEGNTEGDYTEIKSGLKPGDIVVMTGVDKLQEGTAVTVQMADESKPGKSTPPPRPTTPTASSTPTAPATQGAASAGGGPKK